MSRTIAAIAGPVVAGLACLASACTELALDAPSEAGDAYLRARAADSCQRGVGMSAEYTAALRDAGMALDAYCSCLTVAAEVVGDHLDGTRGGMKRLAAQADMLDAVVRAAEAGNKPFDEARDDIFRSSQHRQAYDDFEAISAAPLQLKQEGGSCDLA